MSIDIADAGRYVFYLNFRTLGDGTNFVESSQEFNFAELIDDSSKYILSVERFRVPIQSIPVVPNIPAAITMLPKAGGGVPQIITVNDSFGYADFRRQLNANANLDFSLSPDGRATIDFDFTNFSLVLDARIAAIFDMDQVLGLTLVGLSRIIGATPIFDRMDQLYKIEIQAQTGLSGIQQEIINTNIFRNILTDFLIPSQWSSTVTNSQGIILGDSNQETITYQNRQDLEFNASTNRRYIMLRGNAPIQNVKIEVKAIFRDGTVNRIRMPPNTIFECKLAFWKK